MEAIFRVDGNDVDTSPYAAGPWHPSMQHGSPPAALVVWAAEKIPTQGAMRVARVTVDLMRPVPVAPLTIESEVVRDGRTMVESQRVILRPGQMVTAAFPNLRQDQAAVPRLGPLELRIENRQLLSTTDKGRLRECAPQVMHPHDQTRLGLTLLQSLRDHGQVRDDGRG